MATITILLIIVVSLYAYQTYFRKDYDELDGRGHYVNKRKRKAKA
jgi:hypothetical protein